MYYNDKASSKTETANGTKKFRKKIKKFLTKALECDKIVKLTFERANRTLKIKQRRQDKKDP